MGAVMALKGRSGEEEDRGVVRKRIIQGVKGLGGDTESWKRYPEQQGGEKRHGRDPGTQEWRRTGNKRKPHGSG